MGLFADLATTVTQTMKGVDPAVVPSCTYTRQTGGAYNASTGALTPSTTTATCDAIFADYTVEERANEALQANDQKALIASQALAFEPAVDDSLTKPDGSVWTIVAVGTDPAQALWVCQVRRPS